MKKLSVMTAAAAMLAMPAMAQKMTISFASDDGNTVEITFNQATMKGSAEGLDGEFDYTWDAETRTLCGDGTGQGETCATFAEANETPAVGDTSAYTTSYGGSGTATITALED